MTNKQEQALEKLQRLCNALADDLDSLSDDDLLAELGEFGENVDGIATQTSNLVAETVQSVGRRKLAVARAAYTAHTTSQRSNVSEWPVERKRFLLQQFAQNDNTIKQELTLAARNRKDEEVDLDSFIEDLIELGVIDDEGNAT